MKKVAFLNDTSDWYHWGCTGTSTAIGETLAERGYDVTPVPIQSIYACQPVPQTTADFDSRDFFNRFYHGNLAVTGPILQSDIVVINGEGSLHGLSPMALLLLYLAHSAKRICNKQVQIINHSCYPDSSGADVAGTPIGAIYQGVYGHLDFVAVREHRSQEVLKSLGTESTLAFDCLPLYIRRHCRDSSAARPKTIVISGSVAWRPEGITGLAAYMRSMAADGYAVKVLTGAKAHPAQDDVQFLSALRQALPDGWVHVDAPSMEEWLDTIQKAALLVSGRFHYTVAACSLVTPCIVLDSNTPKNRAICAEAGMPEPLAYTAENLEAALRERTQAALGHAPLTHAIRQEWVDRATKNFLGLPA